jgi:hypothetical protein
MLSLPIQYILRTNSFETDWKSSHSACFQAVRHTAVRHLLQELLCFDDLGHIYRSISTPGVYRVPAHHSVAIHVPVELPPSVFSSGVVYIHGACTSPLFIPPGIYDTYQNGVLLYAWNLSAETVVVNTGSLIARIYSVERGRDQAALFEMVFTATHHLYTGVVLNHLT